MTGPCILLIDDHAVVRAGCRLLLDRRGEVDLIEADNGRPASGSAPSADRTWSFSI